MDLAALITNKPLLAELSVQYEALKRAAEAGECAVDYEAWIRQRLRQAAASSSSSSAAAQSTGTVPPRQRSLAEAQRSQQAVCAQQRLAYRTQLRQRQRVGAAVAALEEEQQTAPGGNGWGATDITNSWGGASGAVNRSTQPPCKQQPNWVSAASLQAALLGSGRAVPAMQAAAERERRLALTAALAAQDVSMGLPCPAAASAANAGGAAAAGGGTEDAPGSGTPPTAFLALHLAAQAQELRKLVKQQGQQMKRQEALLQQMLSGQQQQQVVVAEQGQTEQERSRQAEDAPLPVAAPALLPDAARNSWLVRSVLGDKMPPPPPAVAAPAAAAEEETTATRSCEKRQAAVQAPVYQQQQQQQQEEGFLLCSASDDRQQRKEALKAALRQALMGGGGMHLQQQPDQAPTTSNGAAILAQLVPTLLSTAGNPQHQHQHARWGIPPSAAAALAAEQAAYEEEEEEEEEAELQQQQHALRHPSLSVQRQRQHTRSDPGPPAPPRVVSALKQQARWIGALREEPQPASASPAAAPCSSGRRAKPQWDDRPAQPLPRHLAKKAGALATSPAPLPLVPKVPPGRQPGGAKPGGKPGAGKRRASAPGGGSGGGGGRRASAAAAEARERSDSFAFDVGGWRCNWKRRRCRRGALERVRGRGGG